MPVTRFCEWTTEPDPGTKRKNKVWFGLADDTQPLFAFAGIWRRGEIQPYMAFLTCDPNQTVGAIHPKAMPVMLRTADVPRWLEDERVSACQLAVPFPDEEMAVLS